MTERIDPCEDCPDIGPGCYGGGGLFMCGDALDYVHEKVEKDMRGFLNNGPIPRLEINGAYVGLDPARPGEDKTIRTIRYDGIVTNYMEIGPETEKAIREHLESELLDEEMDKRQKDLYYLFRTNIEKVRVMFHHIMRRNNLKPEDMDIRRVFNQDNDKENSDAR